MAIVIKEPQSGRMFEVVEDLRPPNVDTDFYDFRMPMGADVIKEWEGPLELVRSEEPDAVELIGYTWSQDPFSDGTMVMRFSPIG